MWKKLIGTMCLVILFVIGCQNPVEPPRSIKLSPPDSSWPSDGSTISSLLPLLDWEDVEGAAGYHAQVNTIGNFKGKMVVDNDLLVVSKYQVIAALSDATAYFWHVRVKNTDGVWGDWSSTWSFIADITIPSNPYPASGSTTVDTTPLLNWEDVADTSGYHIQVNTDSSFTGTMIGEDNALIASQYQVLSMLSDNTTYYWHVRGRNTDGVWGDWSSTWSLAVDITPPSNPSPASGSTTVDTTPLLNWEDVADTSGYHIQVNTDSSFTGTMIEEDNALIASQYQALSMLSDNTTYYWHVRGRNTDGVWGDWSSTWSLAVDIAPPSNPSPASGSNLFSTAPILNWEDIANISGYHVQVNTNNSFTGTMVVDSDSFVVSEYHVTASLSDKTTYYWHVRGRNTDGVWGDWSSTWSFTAFNLMKFTASDGATGDEFGYSSISISGDNAIVGSLGDDDKGSFSGSAYIFHWNGSSWMEQQKLVPSDGTEQDNFGREVAISVDSAIVGSAGDDDKGSYSGSAYIFRWNGSTWVEQQKLVPSDGTAFDHFAQSVAINGDNVIVGAIGDDDKGSGSGSAYVFHWNGSSWVEQQKLTAGDGATEDEFGQSVAISGDRAVVGANLDDDKGSGSGSAYIFRWNGSTWVEQQKLVPSDGTSEDFFGDHVAISGDWVIVGVLHDDDNGINSGSAYLYQWNGAVWVEQQKIIASTTTEGDLFGCSIGIDGDMVIVGANGNDNKGDTSGSAYIFLWNGSEWEEELAIFPNDGTEGDSFGNSVSIFGNRVLIGAFGDDDNGDLSGSAYILEY